MGRIRETLNNLYEWVNNITLEEDTEGNKHLSAVIANIVKTEKAENIELIEKHENEDSMIGNTYKFYGVTDTFNQATLTPFNISEHNKITIAIYNNYDKDISLRSVSFHPSTESGFTEVGADVIEESIPAGNRTAVTSIIRPRFSNETEFETLDSRGNVFFLSALPGMSLDIRASVAPTEGTMDIYVFGSR